MRQGVFLDLVPSNREGLVRNVKFRGSLGCSNREMVKLKNMSERSKAKSRVVTLDFQRANSNLFWGLLGSIYWASMLEGKGVHES